MPPPRLAASVPPPRLALLALWSFAPGSRGDYASWDIPDNLMVWPKELIWPVHDGTPKTSYFGEGWEDPVTKAQVYKALTVVMDAQTAAPEHELARQATEVLQLNIGIYCNQVGCRAGS